MPEDVHLPRPEDAAAAPPGAAARRARARGEALALLARLRDLEALRRAGAGSPALDPIVAGGNARLIAEVAAAAERLGPAAHRPATEREVERTAYLLESLAGTVGALEVLLARRAARP